MALEKKDLQKIFWSVLYHRQVLGCLFLHDIDMEHSQLISPHSWRSLILVQHALAIYL